MPTPPNPAFAGRDFHHDAVATYPWPTTAGYADIHRWMEADEPVHAAWQVRDVWEGLIKFLGILTIADHLAAARPADLKTSRLFALLLKPQGLSLGDWPRLMELALKDGPAAGIVPGLRELLLPDRRSRLMPLFVGGDAGRSFVAWRNRRFGHGAFGRELTVFAEEARHWLDQLHEAYDLCRDCLPKLVLESDDPVGDVRPWGQDPPLQFYHAHRPVDATRPLLAVRLRVPGRSAALDLTPLLSVQPCAVCRRWAAFYFDRYEPARHRGWFLDFVDGHSHDRRDVATLRSWAVQVRAEDAAARAAQPLDPTERREPDPDRFRDFKAEFEPPVYLAEPVAAFIRGHDRGAVLLTGPGGCGKSWVCQGLDHPAMLPALLGRAVPFLYAAVSGADPSKMKPVDVLGQLAEYARRVKEWRSPERTADDPPGLAEWLRGLMAANSIGELVVALDGWDELPAESEVPSILPRPGNLPPRCYLLLASRPSPRRAAAAALADVRRDAKYVREVEIGTKNRDHRRVRVAYATKRLAQLRPDGQPLPADWAGRVVDLAEGSFLHVYHYCRALRFSIYSHPGQLPRPDDYYPAFFEHLKKRVGEELFESYYARTLALIAGGYQIGIKQLVSWGLERGRLVVVLDDLADLLRTQRDDSLPETVYELGHDTIRSYLEGDPVWKARIDAARRESLLLTYRRLAADGWADLDLTDPHQAFLIETMALDLQLYPELQEYVWDNLDLAHTCLRLSNAPDRSLGRVWWLGGDYALAPTAALVLLKTYRASRQADPINYAPRPHYGPDGCLTAWARTRGADAAHFDIADLSRKVNRPELWRLLAAAYAVRAMQADQGHVAEVLGLYERAVGVLVELLRTANRQPPDQSPSSGEPLVWRRPDDASAAEARVGKSAGFFGRLLRWLGWRSPAGAPLPSELDQIQAVLRKPLRLDLPDMLWHNLRELYQKRAEFVKELGRHEDLLATAEADDAFLRTGGDVENEDVQRARLYALSRQAEAILELDRADKLLPVLEARQAVLENVVRRWARPSDRIDLALNGSLLAGRLRRLERWRESLSVIETAIPVLEEEARSGSHPDFIRQQLLRSYLLRAQAARALGFASEGADSVRRLGLALGTDVGRSVIQLMESVNLDELSRTDPARALGLLDLPLRILENFVPQ